jgi:hypothetical protein
MTDRGIIFSAPMVCALRSGRKTQTRRLATSPLRRCVAGDRLWVRESFRFFASGNDDGEIHYADDRLSHVGPCSGDVPDEGLVTYFKLVDRSHNNGAKVSVPAIHMPRWASRLTLIVEGVRTEPVQEISREDAIAEGIAERPKAHGLSTWGLPEWRSDQCFYHPGNAYASLWKSLHTKEGERWADNPEVLVLTFRVELSNIDRIAA